MYVDLVNGHTVRGGHVSGLREQQHQREEDADHSGVVLEVRADGGGVVLGHHNYTIYADQYEFFRIVLILNIIILTPKSGIIYE